MERVILIAHHLLERSYILHVPCQYIKMEPGFLGRIPRLLKASPSGELPYLRAVTVRTPQRCRMVCLKQSRLWCRRHCAVPYISCLDINPPRRTGVFQTNNSTCSIQSGIYLGCTRLDRMCLISLLLVDVFPGDNSTQHDIATSMLVIDDLIARAAQTGLTDRAAPRSCSQVWIRVVSSPRHAEQAARTSGTDTWRLDVMSYQRKGPKFTERESNHFSSIGVVTISAQ